MGGHVSVFLIPIGGMAVAIVAIVAGIAGEGHRQRVVADQRLAMIARGMSVDEMERVLRKPDADARPVRNPRRSLANTRRAGIILIASGVGLALFFIALTLVLNTREILSGAAVGLVPIMIGMGFLIDYQLQKRDLSRFGLELDSAD